MMMKLFIFDSPDHVQSKSDVRLSVLNTTKSPKLLYNTNNIMIHLLVLAVCYYS